MVSLSKYWHCYQIKNIYYGHIPPKPNHLTYGDDDQHKDKTLCLHIDHEYTEVKSTGLSKSMHQYIGLLNLGFGKNKYV